MSLSFSAFSQRSMRSAFVSKRQSTSICEFLVIASTIASSSAGVNSLPSSVSVIWADPQKRALSRNFFPTAASSSSKGIWGSRMTVIPALLLLITTALRIDLVSFMRRPRLRPP